MTTKKFKLVIFIVLLGFTNGSSGDSSLRISPRSTNDEVNDLVNLITQTEEKSQIYLLPKNAGEYRADNNYTTDYGTFNFIIIGAGSAGTVIANRLSEMPHWSILLLEAGDFGNNLTDIPDMYTPLEFTKYNWGFTSTTQESSCLGMVDKICPQPRGKGIGGSTLINGLVYSRGSSIDFDRWAEQVNDSRWSYDRVLSYFKKSESFHHRDSNAPVNELVHGKDGPLYVEYHLPRSPQLNAFLKANEELELPVADYNAGTGLGASPAQINTKDGRRFDGGKAFVHPALNRPNLHVLQDSYVTKILIHKNNKTAYGVSFTNNNRNYIATAEKEVIVSAGAISSPQILMLSGIGPRHHLESVNISVIENLEVGTILRDHPTFYGLNFETNYAEPIKPLKDYVEEYLKGYGPLTTPGNDQGVGFYESQFTKGTGWPDIEIMFIPANASSDLTQRALRLTTPTYEDAWGHLTRTKSFAMYIAGLHAASTGTVRLKSNDPFKYPLIDTKFLSDPEGRDISTIYEGIQLGLKLSNTPAFRKLDTKLKSGPLRACEQHKYLSKQYWYCAIRQVTKALNHPVGTCPMGQFPEKGDVVNSKLQVHGVRRLRVADGSVFPFTLAGHSNAPIVMVGEVLSDIIKEAYPPNKCYLK